MTLLSIGLLIVGAVQLFFQRSLTTVDARAHKIETNVYPSCRIGFDEVLGFQIISLEYPDPNGAMENGVIHVYELNIVCRNGNRHNILAYRNREALLRDANTLAALLDAPLLESTVPILQDGTPKNL